MAKTRLSPAATYVERGYGQVEPNHLSAQRTAQIYAQLPAADGINVLENGQFVKYDYANGVVNTTCPTGEWMLVFNEVKVYRDHESDSDFAMKKEDYVARIYSPMGDITGYANARDYEGVVNAYEHDITSTTNPFVIEQREAYTTMPEGSTMVPRVFKTNVGDIYTTNMVKTGVEYTVGQLLVPVKNNNSKTLVLEAFSAPTPGDKPTGMAWAVVQVYTMPDGQPGLKLQRVQ
jgi:hypothetical protein